jgi:hypothetical protein
MANIEEKIRPEGYLGCFCLKIKPASHFDFLCIVTIFRAFHGVLVIDVLNCVIYSIFILLGEI